MDDDLRTPGERPDGTDQTASEDLERKLDHVAEEWRRETHIAEAQRKEEAEAFQRKVDAEAKARDDASVSRYADNWLWCCSGCSMLGLSCIVLGLVAAAGLRRTHG